MNIETIGATDYSPPRVNEPAQQVERKRQEIQEPQSTPQKSKAQPEELLKQIKSLTEDGLYSVRFENDERSKELVVKIVDADTQEVIRQVPAEEVLGIKAALADLQGNLVDVKS